MKINQANIARSARRANANLSASPISGRFNVDHEAAAANAHRCAIAAYHIRVCEQLVRFSASVQDRWTSALISLR